MVTLLHTHYIILNVVVHKVDLEVVAFRLPPPASLKWAPNQTIRINKRDPGNLGYGGYGVFFH